MISYGQQQFPGKLFVVEGTDGSGKSTQLALHNQSLKAEGYPVFFSEWNSSPLVKDTTRRAKKRHLFTPATFSLLHATDFADRTEREIIPPFKAGAISLAERYLFDRMSNEFGFNVLNASRPVRSVASDLHRAVTKVVDETSDAEEAVDTKQTAILRLTAPAPINLGDDKKKVLP